MESFLDVLSRAAAMVQDNANETRLTTKELPTTKWRRERRLRATEYQQHSSSSSTSPTLPSTPPPQRTSSPRHVMKPLNETTNTTSLTPITTIAASSAVGSECPIDMSVTSTTIKPRTPPPPYREPLPGSTFASLARPSVITQAPPKRDNHHNNLISNRENDNRSTESISMCDPVIDEHFRRSLGADYMALFGKKSTTSSTLSPTSSSLSSPPLAITPQPQQPKPAISPISPKTTITVTNNESIGLSVDDHFAKALGDTWKKLQADKDKDSKNEATTPSASAATEKSPIPTSIGTEEK